MLHPLTHSVLHPLIHGVVGHRLRGGRKPLTDAIILALFSNGEQGAYYDPYDLTDEKLAWVSANPSFTSAEFMAQFPQHTLFQDSLGTIPVTGNMQPLGLGLDKRFGGVRGENVNRELIPSNYQSAGSGSPQMSMTGGSITVTNTSNGSTVFRDPTATLTQGVLYEVLIFVDAANMDLAINVPINVPLNLGLNRVLIPSTDNTSIVRIGSVSSQSVGAFYTISQFTVRPILGNHASQPNSAFRMLWQNNNGIKTFYRDGVDDALSVTLPAATYARIVANTGTGYATNTVVHGGGALNILGSGAGNSAGYILIDRALTPAESADVETLFNKRAGL